MIWDNSHLFLHQKSFLMTKKYAHITQADNTNSHIKQRTQDLDVHGHHVGEMAGVFATHFGFRDIAYIMGLLHDKGKEQQK